MNTEERDKLPMNLRREGEALVPGGAPAVYAEVDARVSHVSVSEEDERDVDILYADGKRVYLLRGEERKQVAIAGSDVREMTSPGEHWVILTCADGSRMELERDESGEWKERTVRRIELPEVVQVEAERVTARVGDTTVERGRDTVSPVSYSGAQKLTPLMRKAYMELRAAARVKGAYMQPVFVRVRLLDDRGRVLAESRPRLIGEPVAVTGYGTLTPEDERTGTVSDLTLSAPLYRLSVRWDNREHYPEVERVEVYVSPEIEPADGEALSEITGSANEAGGYDLQVTLPGVTGTGMPYYNPEMCHRALRALPEESVGMPTVSLHRGQTAASEGYYSTVTGQSTGSGQTPSEGEANRAMRLARAGRFTARVTARGGGYRLWGDVTVTAPTVRPSDVLRASDENAATGVWNCATVLESPDGKMVERQAIVGGRPTEVPAFVMVDDPLASSLLIDVEGRRRRLALRPLPDGSGAYYLSAQMKPLPLLMGVAGEIPQESAPAQRYPGLVLIADESEPLRPRGGMLLSERVRVLAPVMRHSTAWQSNRTRFTAITRDGTLTLDPERLTMAHIAPGLTVEQTGCAVTPDRLIVAIGERLLSVTAGAVQEMGRLPVRVERIAWHGPTSELWMRGEDGWLYCRSIDGGVRRTAVKDAEPMGDERSRVLYFAGATRLYRLEEAGERQAVEMNETVKLPRVRTRARRLTIDMRGSEIHGTVSVLSGDMPMMQVTIDGIVRMSHELPLNLLVPDRVTLQFRGNVSSDTRIYGLKID